MGESDRRERGEREEGCWSRDLRSLKGGELGSREEEEEKALDVRGSR